MYLLSKELFFPPVEFANEDGLLAIGGDLSVKRLKLAYQSGIFPWYNEGEPIIWYSPNPRMVLFPNKLKTSKSMRQFIRKHEFEITFNKDFEGVISKCKNVVRKGQKGTWITNAMKEAYMQLNSEGLAKSVEVWKLINKAKGVKKLVGGLYGVDLGHVFCGESMFSEETNSSKLAFIYLVQKLAKEKYQLIDCQVYNNHLASLGAEEIPRTKFLKILNN